MRTWQRLRDAWDNHISPMAKWFLFLIIVAVVMFCVTVSQAHARTVCVSAVEFVPRIPEHTFIQGIAETVQMGVWQIDPDNPWPAGDLTRSGGWKSHYETRLIDVATGQAPEGFEYNGATGELRYLGGPKRDVTVKLTQAGVADSAAFRIRVLVPNNVWGANAAAVNAEMGWAAPRVCTFPGVSFASCKAGFRGGVTDDAPMVLFFTSGNYGSQDWYIGKRAYAYIEGDSRDRPQLVGDALSTGESRMASYRNLDLISTEIAMTHESNSGENLMNVSKVKQCCETGAVNGVVNPSSGTEENFWNAEVWNSEFIGTGNPGNTTHSFYIEGRPNSRFALNNVRIMGSQGSSSIKTIMQTLEVRHSLLSVSRTIGDLSGPCSSSDRSGCLTHTPIDVPAYSNVIIYGNKFYMWRQTTVGTSSGKAGILAGVIFLRKRESSLGSDVPAYPNVSWDPPVSTQYGLSPGAGWPKGPSTYVDDAFWAQVAATPRNDPAHPLTFKHYISFNTFVQLPGSLPVTIVRDDGTMATRAVYQFGPGEIMLTHRGFIERSWNFMYGNRYEGVPPDYIPRFQLRTHQYTTAVQEPRCNAVPPRNPCTKWPRENYGEEVYPGITEVMADQVPAWFKL